MGARRLLSLALLVGVAHAAPLGPPQVDSTTPSGPCGGTKVRITGSGGMYCCVANTWTACGTAAGSGLASDPSPCPGGQFVTDQNAAGVLTCSAPPAQDWAVVTGKPSTFTPATHTHGGGDVTSSVATATALDANPADCTSGQYATTIDASGNLACAQVAYGQVSGTPAAYSLPAATATVLGGVKGTGSATACTAGQKALGWDAAGTLQCGTDADTIYTLPNASTTLGGVKMAAACAAGNHISSIVAGELTCSADAGGSGAPTGATYITQTADAGLSAEQALSGLTTGLVKVTNGTGALSTAVAGTDYQAPITLPLSAANGGLGQAQPTCTAFQHLTCNGTTCSCTRDSAITMLTATWASSASANTTGIVGTGGVPMTSPTYAAGAAFGFECIISTTRPATTNGPRYGVAASSGSVTRISATHQVGLAATTRTETKVVTAMTTNCAAGCSTAMTTGTLAQVEDDFIRGTGVMNASGTLSLYMAPSAAAANTAQIGSFCRWF